MRVFDHCGTVRLSVIVLLTGLLIATAAPSTAGPDDTGRIDTGTYTSGVLTYGYEAFVPGDLPANPALVVMIHGCKTTAEQQRRANLLDPIARNDGFVVLYVDGSPFHLLQQRCWSGLLAPASESRASGDAAAIAAMTRLAIERYHIDPDRVYALGMSSGAYETTLLGAYFADLFAAIGVHSGAAFDHGALGCVGPYLPTASTEQLAAQAFSAEGRYRRVLPVIGFHGDADLAVPYECGREVIEQWRQTDNLVLAAQEAPQGIPVRPTGSAEGVADRPEGLSYAVESWRQHESDCPTLQLWTIHGMAHYWSGGSADPDAAEFTDARGPNASQAAWDFFSRIHRTDTGFRCE
ncbi:extracellular catalytic domain type 1 short-chain-length polyhydroxyalkanoate depolymerase [Nocardia sp. CA-145437]|uniref:extracellular catalytic domain type 1 short-chain-length polyhydroxyalkanoate depolymerase n=1 Tax=Nocardia sp. CA-145437 TaxID=3239980 RepID=UPI003D95678F